jgi:hypothetical protein
VTDSSGCEDHPEGLWLDGCHGIHGIALSSEACPYQTGRIHFRVFLNMGIAVLTHEPVTIAMHMSILHIPKGWSICWSYSPIREWH